MESDKANTLTAKQVQFCKEYLLDLNGTKAAIRAGFSEKTACSIGSRLLRNVNIQEYISELKRDLESLSGITKLKVLNSFAEIAFSNLSRLHDSWIERKEFDSIAETDKGAICEISSKIIKKNIGTIENPVLVDVEFVKIKLHDKIKALENINRMLGFNNPEKIDLTTQGQKITQTREEILAEIEEIRRKRDGRN